MLSPKLMEVLRCPLSSGKEELQQEEHHLLCQRCNLRFPLRDGFPSLIAEEAELPGGCESLDQLPCQQEKEQGN